MNNKRKISQAKERLSSIDQILKGPLFDFERSKFLKEKRFYEQRLKILEHEKT